MRICIPTETDEGVVAKVYGHFGSAPYFTVYDSRQKSYETIDNSNQRHVHGTCHPMTSLTGKNIDAIVCIGMGSRAVLSLNDAGIKTYRANGETVEQIVSQLESNRLEEITVEDACSQHRCHD
jgi:predicted Fe-Mo cluster-binding NifX family protein